MIDGYEKHTCTECETMFTSNEELQQHHTIDHGLIIENSIEWSDIQPEQKVEETDDGFTADGKTVTFSDEDKPIAESYLTETAKLQRVMVASEQRLKLARDEIKASEAETNAFYEQFLGESNGQDFSSGAGTIKPLDTPKFKYSKNNKLADTINTKGYNPNPNAGLYDNKEFKEGGDHLEDPLAKEDFEVSFYSGESKASEDYGNHNRINQPDIQVHGFPRDAEGHARASWDRASIDSRKYFLESIGMREDPYSPFYSLSGYTQGKLATHVQNNYLGTYESKANEGLNECTNCDGYGKEECDNCIQSGNSFVVRCPECDGHGKDDNDDICGECGGDGEVLCDVCDNTGEITCNVCGGIGEVNESKATEDQHTDAWDEKYGQDLCPICKDSGNCNSMIFHAKLWNDVKEKPANEFKFGEYEVKCDCDKDPDCKTCGGKGTNTWSSTVGKSDESLKADWDDSGYEEKYSWLKDLGVEDAFKYANMTLYELPEPVWKIVNEDYVKGFKQMTGESYTPDQKDTVETSEEKIISRKLDGTPVGQIARELVLWDNMSEDEAEKMVSETEPSDNDMSAKSLFNKKYSELNENELAEMELYDV